MMGVCFAGSDNLVRSWIHAPKLGPGFVIPRWDNVHFQAIYEVIHYFLRVFSMTSHQRFKSIGEVFLMTFLHGKFHFYPWLIKIAPSREPWSTTYWLRVSMYRKRTPFDPSEVYDEAAAREWNWNSDISDWSSNLISSNLIRRSNWLLNYFW